MSEPESDALRIGDWVARAGLSAWLGDRWLGNADDLVAALAPRIAGTIDRRRLVREFDQIADTVAERLLALTGLAEHELYGAISAVSRTLDHAVLPERDRWDRGNPAQLARLISGAGVALPAHDVVLRASCVAVCEALSHLPPDVEEFTGLLREPDAIAAAVGEVMARQQARGEDDVTVRYLRFIAESMDHLELVGVRSARPTEYSLTEGFVAPLVQRPDTAGNDGLPFVKAVANRRRLLVRGEAGAGKTTALGWLAVQAARGDLPGLGQAVPLVVRLRSHLGGALDPVQRLAEAVVHPPDDRVSAGWIHSMLNDGTALLLVDGLDEIPEPNRSRAWAWLRELVTAFPNAHLVVSTRPSALGEHEQDPRFDVVDLMPMTRSDVDKFVRSWYRMVAPADGGQARYERTLRDALAVNPHLGTLATSPMMCSLLCALTMERATALPRNHEIYQAVLDMLDGPARARPDRTSIGARSSGEAGPAGAARVLVPDQPVRRGRPEGRARPSYSRASQHAKGCRLAGAGAGHPDRDLRCAARVGSWPNRLRPPGIAGLPSRSCRPRPGCDRHSSPARSRGPVARGGHDGGRSGEPTSLRTTDRGPAAPSGGRRTPPRPVARRCREMPGRSLRHP